MITRKKTVKSGTTIHYSVSAPGYITQEGDVLMDSDKTLNITLQQVSPDPPSPTGNWATWTGGNVASFKSGNNSYSSKPSPITKGQYPGNLTQISFSQNKSLTSVDFLDGTYLTSLQGAFYDCSSLVSLPVIDCSNVRYGGMFSGNLSSLTTLGGFVNLGQAFDPSDTSFSSYHTLDLSQAPNLTKQSVLNLFSGLYNISGSGNTGTITLTQALVDSLSASERAFATNKGWTLLPNPTPEPAENVWAEWVGGTTGKGYYTTTIGGKNYNSLGSPIRKDDYSGNLTKISFGTDIMESGSSLTRVISLDSQFITDFTAMFINCKNLTSIPQFDTSNGTDFTAMFEWCWNLTSIPLLDTSNGTDFTAMFDDCWKLTSIPQLDTSKGTNFSFMFRYCYRLAEIPYLDTHNGTNFNGMFSNCNYLPSIPQLDTSKGTDFRDMFLDCYRLAEIPYLDTHNGTNFYRMFYECTSLTSIPQLDTSKGTDFSNMFYNCTSLSSIPSIYTHNGTSFSNMFSGCTSLSTIPQLDTSNGTDFTAMFEGCTNLTSIPQLDVSNGRTFIGTFGTDSGKEPNYTGMFNRCTSLTTVDGLIGLKYGVSFESCPLTHQSAVNVLNNLGIAANSSQKITFKSSTYRTLTAAEMKLATDKGWKVESA